MAHEEALALARSGRLQASRRSSSRAVDLALQEGTRGGSELSGRTSGVGAVAGILPKEKERHGGAGAFERSRCPIRRWPCPGSFGRLLSIRGACQRFRKAPPGRYFREIYLSPVLRALSALERGKPTNSVQQLQIALPYELAANGLNFNHFYLGGLHSAYVRGEAFIASHRYVEAAAEFQKVLDHRGLVGLDPIGALSHLQLGRAYALSGDKIKAKSAYEDFFTLWKDADSDVPILKRARAEYDRL